MFQKRFLPPALILGSLLGFSACTSTHTKDVFLANMPAWMLEDRSSFVTQGIDSSHVIDGQVARSEKIAKERARFRVAQHIGNKIKELFKQTQNANGRPFDDNIFKQIVQAISASLDKEVQLGEYINPNNQEVFILVRVDGYDRGLLEKNLLAIKTLHISTIRALQQEISRVFKDAMSYGQVKVPQSM
ncbi:hypothetical protein [Helicobacter ailurogastricus]|uniref:Putative n=1 Tax=Helicobacter ailurogastricus TaxID=1578720 RepID=A0A0K2Y166_9HELI|nr:hypothetical protein [Helicobacter ailurogastricus]BDQ28485.1 tumor necrosis factor alpha-inducing protein [Helicobacter ailurogastricus]GLH57707.1 Tumor necrosis factor alpha-inducing protein [Helicobacter ailurogastricus]GLH58884.1 Tumor necrosis factor alpha-inducing protein [Helicobacter ailurogastricus]CRF53016.1 putative [Helicobacter ailurogastricus]